MAPGDLKYIFLLIFVEQMQGESLFRVSPGGDGSKPAGLWGGNLERHQNGQAGDLFSHGYQSLNTSYANYYGIEIKYISYDPIGKRTLMVVDDPDSSSESTQHAMAFGYLCKDGQVPLDATFINFRLVDNGNPYLMEDDCGWKCGWGPFALYDNKVYFVLSAVLGRTYVDLTRVIQIRVLEGCEDIINIIRNKGANKNISDFPVMECSRHIQTVYSELYTKPNPRPKVWIASELKVVDHNSELHFFTQLIDTYLAEPQLDLIHVSNNVTNTLSTGQINSIYTGNLRTYGLGAVDYKDGVLCWTVGDSLQCSLYQLDGEDMYILPILKPGDALAADICLTGSIVQDDLKQTLTGVAISDTDDTLSVYFGCYANIPATGGVGLIRISNHGLNNKIYEVKSGGTKIYGGSLFIAETVDEGCLYTTTKKAMEGTIPPYTVSPPARANIDSQIEDSSDVIRITVRTLIIAFLASNMLL